MIHANSNDMASSANDLMAAFQCHQRGDYHNAETVYRRILASEQNNLEACQLLGALLVQVGRPSEAIPLIQKAIQLQPAAPQFYANLGVALSKCNDLVGAEQQYRHALSLKPDFADAAKNLGTLLLRKKRYAEAVPFLTQAIRSGNRSKEVFVQLAVSLLKSGDHEASIPYFEKVLAASPQDKQCLAGLGQALLQREKPDERCVECWQKLLELDPENAGAHNNLATVLKNMERFPEAEEACHRALAFRPDFFPALCNLGLTLAGADRFDEAVIELTRATKLWESGAALANLAADEQATSTAGMTEASLRENATLAYCQLGAVLNILGRADEAHQAIERGLKISPQDSECRLMRGFLEMAAGNLTAGWDDYELRAGSKHPPREFPKPKWKGESLPQATLLLHAEQGLGDTFHFVRYAPLVRERVGKVLFLCHRPITELISNSELFDEVIPDGDRLPPFDYHLPLLSLPRIFGTSLETIPANVPYLTARPDLVELWRERLGADDAVRVGICWQGNTDFAHDRHRSIPLRNFSPLADVPRIELVSLQVGAGTEQLNKVGFEVRQFPDLDQRTGPFMDTAALLKCLDLVITSDTSVAHLAGALGCPTWLALSAAPEWRWFQDRSDSPWYPTMRLFRQDKLGHWPSVFEAMAEQLRRWPKKEY